MDLTEKLELRKKIDAFAEHNQRIARELISKGCSMENLDDNLPEVKTLKMNKLIIKKMSEKLRG